MLLFHLILIHFTGFPYFWYDTCIFIIKSYFVIQAAIVGSYTKKVLFLGVRNKYCTVCARAGVNGSAASSHNCYKNWSGSSTSMEADIILEGFQQSLQMYGAIYGTILADGDSNVYSKLIECRPYSSYTVEKIECTNHLLGNYCSKIRDIVVHKNAGPINLRKIVGKNILRLRSAVTKAVQFRKREDIPSFSQKITSLQKDMINSPSHIFGEHLRCKELKYFCQGPKEGEENLIPEMKKFGMYQQIMRHVSYLAANAKSLLLNETNNPAELFNSIIAKFIGGKRVHFSKKRSYKARCLAAVVAHNTKTPLYTLHKTMYKKSPGKVLKQFQMNRANAIVRAAQRRKDQPTKRKQTRCTQREKDESKKSYGVFAQKPDLSLEQYEVKKNIFM